MPICDVCLKSDMLCGACQGKLDNGRISQADIDVSRFLSGLTEKIKSLEDTGMIRAVDTNILLLVAAKGDAAKLVGKNGAVVKALAKRFNKPIRVLEEMNIRDFVCNALSPVSICGINTVYSQEGETYKVRIPISQKSRLLLTEESFASVMRTVYNKRAEIVFES